jgi:hypothetical protein
MAKESLETKARKSIFRIENKVRDIDNVLRDLSMKLCYIIKKQQKHYSISNGFGYKENNGYENPS